MGGLARRVSYERALDKQLNGQVPILEVDAGHIFADDRTGSDLTKDALVKNEWMLRAADKFRLAAANVTYRDLPYLATLTRKADYKANAKKYPMLERFVAANVAPADDAMTPFKPYVIEEVKGQRLGAKPVRVGIVGLTELQPGSKAAIGGYMILDPVETARKIIPELRKKCDLLVVLAYTDRDVAKRIGMETTGVDMILAARQYPLYNTVEEAGDAVVAYVANQTKWLGEMRLYRAADAKEGQVITSYTHRDVPLDGSLPDDPEAVKVVSGARDAVAKASGVAEKPPGTH